MIEIKNLSDKINPIIFHNVRLKLEAFQNGSVCEEVRNELSEMCFDIRFTQPFDVTGLSIIEDMLKLQARIFVDVYTQNYFKWKVVPVNAYKPSGKKNLIFFNTRNLSRRDAAETEETLWHEVVHVLDDFDLMRIYGHGDDNSLKGKENSAPVKLSNYLASLKLEFTENGQWKITK